MFYSNLMKNRSFLLPYIYGPLISLHILERNDKNINNRRVPMTGAVTWGKLNQVIMLLIFVRFNINQTAPPLSVWYVNFCTVNVCGLYYNFDQMNIHCM